MITREDFSMWRDNHITQVVMSVMRKVAEDARQEWIDASWDGGDIDPAFLASCKATYETYQIIENWSFEDYQERTTEFEQDERKS